MTQASTGPTRRGRATIRPTIPILPAVAALVLVVLLGAGQAALGQSFPALTGRVVDAANLLPAADRAAIEAKLKAHEDRTGDQVVVATVPGLGDLPVEDYANRLFRAWKLGEAKRNNGVLLLVAPRERKVRVEVGYGLEGALTDAVSSLIIRTAITPKFRAGDLPGGIAAGTDAILSVLAGDADEWQRRAAPKPAGIDPDTVVTIIVILFVLFMLWRIMLGFGDGARAHRRRNGSWVVTPSSSSGWSGGGGGWSGGGDSAGFAGGGGSSGGGGASGSW
ncbi:MAG: TPM domain-containing protein [Methylobacteriaceae bacterium]|nr:TPM domain-containing protein [Methylobacteriaceae bacterium]